MTTGNWTKTPNEIYAAVPDMSDAELRVTTALVRQTYGYRREKCSMTYADFRSWGIASDQTVDKGIKAVLKRGFFQRGPGRSEWIIGENSTDFVENDSTESVETTESVESNSTKSVENTADDSTESVELHSSKEKEGEKEKGKKKPPSPPKPETDHQKLMRLYQDALGYPIPDGGQEGKAAKNLLRQYAIEDAIGCYHSMKQDSFWNKKHLSLASVHRQIGAWKTDKPVTYPNGQNGRHPPETPAWIEELNVVPGKPW